MSTTLAAATAPSFSDLSEYPDLDRLPWLDQFSVDASRLTPEQAQWRREGVVTLEDFLPNDLMDAYIARRKRENLVGWISPTPFEHVPELRALALYRPLIQLMRDLVGEEMMLHLALTCWISSERAWHQGDYLNPPGVDGWYAAVWMALDTIHPDSGPFEYYPGSHHWPLLRGHKVRSFMTDEDRAEQDSHIHWPRITERYVVPAVEAEAARRGTPIKQFLGNRGDVLVWHGRLMHRGRKANVPLMERRSLITHYSGVNHRPDMQNRVEEGGSVYAVFNQPPR
jgi:ectoine hydroxylase-related dioxygenase (phytanoyl-CoA dioxygenase family)